MKTHDLDSKDHLDEFYVLMNGVYHLHLWCLSSEYSYIERSLLHDIWGRVNWKP